MIFQDPPPKSLYAHNIPEVSLDIRGNAYSKYTKQYLPYNPHTKMVRYSHPGLNKREEFSLPYLVRRYFYSPYDDYAEDCIKTMSNIGFSRYLVTVDGKVFNTVLWQWQKSVRDFHGYRRYTLQNNSGGKTTVLAHRLVAEIFIPNPNNLPVVDHKDCDPTNNHVSNLRWVSQRDNVEGAISHGHHPASKEQVSILIR